MVTFHMLYLKNHRMVWVRKDLEGHLVPTKALCSLDLNTARVRASATSLGNLFQCVLSVKNFFLISNLNFPFQFVPTPPCPITTIPDKGSLSGFCAGPG